MAPHITLCTGCAGHRRHEYLERLVAEKFISKGSESIKLFRLRDYIIEEAKRKDGLRVSETTILDMEEDRRARYRESAIESILDETKRYQHCIISSPATFRWKGETIIGLRDADISKLNPQVFVTIVADLLPTQRRLQSDQQWRAQQLPLKDLADWRAMEIRETRELARQHGKLDSFYVIPREHPIQVLYDVLFNTRKKAYFSYPLTGASPQDIERARNVIQSLQNILTIFDPYTIQDPKLSKALEDASRSGLLPPTTLQIELQYPSRTETLDCRTGEISDARKHINTQTVRLDFQLVDQSDIVVAYMPEPATGVVCEILHAHERAKPVYAYYPKHPSPFLDYICTEIFDSPEELIAAVKEFSQRAS